MSGRVHPVVLRPTGIGLPRVLPNSLQREGKTLECGPVADGFPSGRFRNFTATTIVSIPMGQFVIIPRNVVGFRFLE